MSTITLICLGTAGFLIQYDHQRLLLDPFFSRPAGALPVIKAIPQDFRDVSLILVSHGHFDHAMDVATVASLSGAPVYAPLKTCTILNKQGVNAAALHPNERHATVEWNGVTIQIVPSRHIRFDTPLIMKTMAKMIRGGTFFEIAWRARHYPLGSNSDFLLNFDGYRILFSGSGGGDWKHLAQLKPDCFLLPFAGRSDLTEYYLNALALLRPKTVVLHHFDTFFPSFCVQYPVHEFQERVSELFPEIDVIVPEPERDITLP